MEKYLENKKEQRIVKKVNKTLKEDVTALEAEEIELKQSLNEKCNFIKDNGLMMLNKKLEDSKSKMNR